MKRGRWDAAQWDAATLTLLTRQRTRCWRCGRLLDSIERHHRQRRRVGGDRLANLVALHPACHAWITEHPAAARERGWIVSAHAPDPAAVPIWLPHDARPMTQQHDEWWLLDDEGGMSPWVETLPTMTTEGG